MGRWGRDTLAARVGQLLSSHGISDCDHALELPNGVIRRPLDAPLKQAVTLVVYSSQCVFVTMTVDSPDTLSSRYCNRSVTQRPLVYKMHFLHLQNNQMRILKCMTESRI